MNPLTKMSDMSIVSAQELKKAAVLSFLTKSIIMAVKVEFFSSISAMFDEACRQGELLKKPP